jgi:hypothetical protein
MSIALDFRFFTGAIPSDVLEVFIDIVGALQPPKVASAGPRARSLASNFLCASTWDLAASARYQLVFLS